MGAILSRSFPFYSRTYALLQTRFHALRMQLLLSEGELWRLFLTYCHAKGRVAGRMTEGELAQLLRFKAQPRPLERRVFLVMKDGLDGISFRSFLVNAWVMCLQDPPSLAHMAFQLYDVSGRGYLGLADVRLMFHEAFGEGFECIPPVALLYRRLVNVEQGSGALSAHIPLARFLALVPAAGSLLAPIFTVQRAMQTHLLGLAAWERIRARRDSSAATGTGFSAVRACLAIDSALAQRRQSLASAASALPAPSTTSALDASLDALLAQAAARSEEGRHRQLEQRQSGSQGPPGCLALPPLDLQPPVQAAGGGGWGGAVAPAPAAGPAASPSPLSLAQPSGSQRQGLRLAGLRLLPVSRVHLVPAVLLLPELHGERDSQANASDHAELQGGRGAVRGELQAFSAQAELWRVLRGAWGGAAVLQGRVAAWVGQLWLRQWGGKGGAGSGARVAPAPAVPAAPAAAAAAASAPPAVSAVAGLAARSQRRPRWHSGRAAGRASVSLAAQ